jgi:hypothetical protein
LKEKHLSANTLFTKSKSYLSAEKKTAETAEALYGLVKKMVDTTAIKAYPSVDYQAV